MSDPLERFDTPAWCTRVLIEQRFKDWPESIKTVPIIDPMAGAGAILKVFAAAGHTWTIGCDLEPRDPSVFAADGIDFMKNPFPGHVVTNPAFSKAAELLAAILGNDLGVTQIWMLLRITWLEPTRNREHLPPPKQVIVLPRPKFIYPDGSTRSTDTTTVAWCGWGEYLYPEFTQLKRAYCQQFGLDSD